MTMTTQRSPYVVRLPFYSNILLVAASFGTLFYLSLSHPP